MSKAQCIELTIAHWERMIAWVKTQFIFGLCDDELMKRQINESWFGPDCQLCLEFSDEYFGCICCPLCKKYGNCMHGIKSNNYWGRVYHSNRWFMWLFYAKRLLKQLKSLRSNHDR